MIRAQLIEIILFILFTGSGSFDFGTKGSGKCDMKNGNAIIEQNLCNTACAALNIPFGTIKGGSKCYMNEAGLCYQDGRHNSNAMIICNVIEKSSGNDIEKVQ